MLLPDARALLCLLLLLPGSTASTNSSIPTVTGQSQPTGHSPEVKNHTSEPLKPTPTTTLSVTSVGQTTTTKSPPTTTTTLPALTEPDDQSSGNTSTAAPTPPPQGQDPTRNESTTTSAIPSASSSQRGTSEPATPTQNSSGLLLEPSPTDDKSPLTVAAFGVISFVVILIVVVIILVSVVSLRFKCNRSKDSEDKQKPGTSMVSESCSADTSQKGNSITLISMKNINTNNSMSYPPSEKVL